MVDSRLVLDALHYWIGSSNILKGVYLEVRPGQVCALFGANGSGKSSLLKLAAGQMSPSSGSVFINGHRFFRPKIRRRFSHLAYLPQQSMLPRRMRVRSVLERLPEAQLEGQVSDLLRPMHNCTFVGDLSLGQLRLLEFLFALSLDRDFVLLDEPFGSVEPLIAERMQSLIAEYAQTGRAILLTDHQYRSVMEVANDAYLLRGGVCLHLDDSRSLRKQLEENAFL